MPERIHEHFLFRLTATLYIEPFHTVFRLPNFISLMYNTKSISQISHYNMMVFLMELVSESRVWFLPLKRCSLSEESHAIELPLLFLY